MRRTLGERRGPRPGFMALARLTREIERHERSKPPMTLPNGARWVKENEVVRWVNPKPFERSGFFFRTDFELTLKNGVWSVRGGRAGGCLDHLFYEPDFEVAFERARGWTPKS